MITAESLTGSRRLISNNRWLWWKEFRMLAPLAGSLVGIAVMMFIMSEFFDRSYYVMSYADDLRLLVPLIFPSLFAAGAGAVLVGQEREMRTIDLMASLPLSPRQWVTTKIVVALMGLAAMWTFSAFCLTVISDGGGLSPRWRIGGTTGMVDAPVGYPLWILSSVYLTFCGFYASWRIRNQFHAIVAVLALASLPLIIGEVYRFLADAIQNRSVHDSEVDSNIFALTAIMTIAFAWASYRAAIRTLSPQASSGFMERTLESPKSTASFWSTAPLLGSSTASLIWQSFRGAPLALALATAMLMAGLALPLLLLDRQSRNQANEVFAFLFLLAPLGASWLGVLVFQNDGSAERVRFLADRGISPTKVYVARHAVPLAALSLCLITYLWIATRRFSDLDGDDIRAVIPSLLTVSIIAWVIYSASQWTSQLFRTLVLSIIVSPIVAMMVLGWFIWVATTLQTPIWILGLCSLLPMVATWWLMPPFMDMRDRPRSFVWATGIIAILICVPIAIAFLKIRSIPGMTSSQRSKSMVQRSKPMVQRSELMERGIQIRRSAPTSVPLRLALRDDTALMRIDVDQPLPIELAEQYIASYPATPGQWIPALSELRERPQSSASLRSDWHRVFDRLMRQRVIFKANQDWDSFGPWVAAASQLVSSLRNSVSWWDQEVADILEIWTVDTLLLPDTRTHRVSDDYQQAIKNLSSKRGRSESRRNAALASWAGFDPQKTEFKFDQGLKYQPVYLATWMQPRRVEAIVAVALSAIEDKSDDWLRQMHELQMPPSSRFEFGPYAPRMRSHRAIELIQQGPLFPARYWGMRWEDDAEQLIQENTQ